MKPTILAASVLALAACTASPTPSARPVADAAPRVAASPDRAVAAPAPTADRGGARGLRASFDPCLDDAEGVTPAIQACIEAELDYQEARLADAVASHKRLLAPAGGAAFDAEQARWAGVREARCGWNARTEGQGQRLEANLCHLRMTAQRADAIADM